MNETTQILKSIIENFSLDKFSSFFRNKNRSFSPSQEYIRDYDDENFKNGLKLGEIQFSKTEKLIVCAFQVKQSLSERSGKKAQYEKGKKILRDTQSDAGIFIFYDQNGNFRFSLIYPETIGNRRQWSNFRRFTYFVSREFTNKTFLQRIGDNEFSSIEKIKDAFSVEKVTKEFYEDIANWYFWAVSHCRFPKAAEKGPDGKDNISVIRLITRMIFIWFMRERGLINKNLFDKQQIQNILKNLENQDSGYYKAILQNLFFATLSTKKQDRDFRSEVRGYRGINPDRGNDNVFRYQKYFKDSTKLKDIFNDIPFLNGGLFECLDDRKNNFYVDGFTESKKDNQPQVPNLLFFGAEQKVDLNKAYGITNKTYKVRGLLDILSSFNFTIDENSPDDADIALDPELLGRVFENLLASFNPETSTTARKATGSYYTPREIVDYMVAESLKAYFKTHLPDVEKIDEKLEQLFSNESSDNPFDDNESKKLVELIESVKIVDPAVGSGAFPMGTLNKLVFILNKVDPGNKLWKEAQLKAADAIPDPSARRMAKERIKEFFEGKNADYGRKLYLIQRCIYGVDIQQIAVEIAKLRFFISLLVDEKIDKDKDNWGIEPLPNLDFKIMQGNSLISEFLGIDFDNSNHDKEQAQTGLLFADEDNSLIKEFEQKKIDFQNEADKDKKAKLKQEVENLMIQIFETKVKKQKGDYFRQLEEIESKYSLLPNQKQRDEIIAQEKQKLSKKSGFDLENIEKQLREFTSKKKTRPFFPWKLYFAEVFEKGGFDVVIANPPYVSFGLRDTQKLGNTERDLLIKKYPDSAEYKISLYAIFMDRAIQLANKNGGVQTYIVPDSFLLGRYFSKIRNNILNNCHIIHISWLPYKIFEATVGFSVIYTFQKFPNPNLNNRIITRHIISNEQIAQKKYKQYKYEQLYFKKQKHNRFRLFFDQYTMDIVTKVENKTIPLGDIIDFNSGLIGKDGKKSIVSSEKKNKDWLPGIISGSEILRYILKPQGYFLLYKKEKIHSGFDCVNYFEDKIFMRQTGDSLISAIDDIHLLCLNNVHVGNLKDNKYSLKYVTAVINSAMMNYFYKSLALEEGRTMAQTDIETIESLPIKESNEKKQQPFIDLVDCILSITKGEDYLNNLAKQATVKEYEKQIDQMVYNLYGLTKEEIDVIESGVKDR